MGADVSHEVGGGGGGGGGKIDGRDEYRNNVFMGRLKLAC